MTIFQNQVVTKKRRVAVYVRVSTAEQKVDGYGLEAQEKRLMEFIEGNTALNLETKKQWIYRDVHTGSDLARENLDRLRADVRAGKFDAVLVWKIDRLSRSLKHLLLMFEEMQRNEVSFISVQENIDFKGPIGSLIFQIFGAIAQFERELIKGRTMMGKIASAGMGNFTGTNIPYGYRKIKSPEGKGSRLELIEAERKWVQRIFEWYIYDELGYGQITKKLNELKISKENHFRTKRAGVQWTNVMVKSIIHNTLYRGAFIANRKDEAGSTLPEGQWTIAKVPACVSEFVFQQAQEASKGRTSAKKTDYLLSGKLVDVDLERPKKFVGAKRTKGGFSYRRKQFSKDGVHYPVFEIPGKQMEDFVWGRIMDALKNPELFIKRYLSRQFADPTQIKKMTDQLESLREGHINESLAIARVESAYEEGRYSEEKMAQKIAERNSEIAKIDIKIQEIEDQLQLMSSADIEVRKLREASEQVKYRLENLDQRQKKILCNLFVDRVEMSRRKEDGRWKVDGQVYFRFNPSKFTENVEEGRTIKSHVKAKHGVLAPKKGLNGGRSQT